MEEIHAEAKKCKFCGEILDPVLRDQEAMKRNSGNAAPGVFHAPVIHKSRGHYILLGLALGVFGVHNFWACRNGVGVAQLLITLFLGWLVVPVIIVGIWVLIELFVVTADGKGVSFSR